ncbi:gas vesicle protein [Streptomyces sp. CB01881]|uniref:gas vesicle protein n=1 Tax=Streptomyces sp. CB01881 TaxID=2078691 RepID=UPI000CDBBDC6|nr:gas vesicle protein [Streptomyces sp. CB01881]AUY47895.1 gas vesicle protein [Streptomyces sp. CB01881]TYC76369.1 gas vesicle protein [Streptomyces sp. CB01881]
MNDPCGTAPGPRPAAVPQRQAALIDLLDRLLSGGVVLTGDVILSIADIDLVRISLRALILSVSEQNPAPRMIGRARGGNSHDR